MQPRVAAGLESPCRELLAARAAGGAVRVGPGQRERGAEGLAGAVGQAHRQVARRVVGAVEVQQRRAVEGQHQQFEVAVVVEVAGQGRAPLVRAVVREGVGPEARRARRAAAGHAREPLAGLGVGRARARQVGLRVHVAVGHEQVQLAVGVEVGQHHAPAQHGPAGGGQPRRRGGVAELQRAQAAVQRVGLVREVGHGEVEAAVAVHVAEVDAHAGLGPAAHVGGRAGQGRDVLEGAVAAVVQQRVVHRVVGHVEVRPAVVVEVGEEQAQAVARRHDVEARGGGDVGKAAAPVAAQQHVGLGRQALGAAHDVVALEAAGHALAAGLVHQRAEGRVGRVDLEVAHQVQVEVAVAVGIRQGHAGGPVEGAAASGQRPGLEAYPCLVARGGSGGARRCGAVQVERVGAQAADDQVDAAVLVHVAGGDAGGPTDALQAVVGGRQEARHAVGHADVEQHVVAHRRARAVGDPGGEALARGAVHQPHVEVAVPVEVGQGGAVAVDLQDGLLVDPAAGERHGQARGGGDLFEQRADLRDVRHVQRPGMGPTALGDDLSCAGLHQLHPPGRQHHLGAAGERHGQARGGGDLFEPRAVVGGVGPAGGGGQQQQGGQTERCGGRAGHGRRIRSGGGGWERRRLLKCAPCSTCAAIPSPCPPRPCARPWPPPRWATT